MKFPTWTSTSTTITTTFFLVVFWMTTITKQNTSMAFTTYPSSSMVRSNNKNNNIASIYNNINNNRNNCNKNQNNIHYNSILMAKKPVVVAEEEDNNNADDIDYDDDDYEYEEDEDGDYEYEYEEEEEEDEDEEKDDFSNENGSGGDDETKTKINNIPEEIPSFADLGLTPQLLSAIKAQPGGWDHPTPVQVLAIPRLLQLGTTTTTTTSTASSTKKLDTTTTNAAGVVDAVWCEAPTGSGKTAAYVLPLLQNLNRQKQQNQQQNSKNNNNNNNQGRIASLILCPTRELAVQIGNVVRNVANNVSYMSKTTTTTTKSTTTTASANQRQRRRNSSRYNVMVLHGGVPLTPQIDELSDYAKFGETLDVLIATPGRLVDVLTYYQEKDDAKDAALERRLLDALDGVGVGGQQESGGGGGSNKRNKKKKNSSDVSLSLEQLERLNLDSILQGDTSDGRDALVNLLEDLQYLILDEADRLLGRAFESELDAVLNLLPPKISTWMFSATFPKSIEPRLDTFLKRIGTQHSPIRIECSHSDRLASDEQDGGRVSSSLQKKLERSTTVSSASKVLSVGPASTIQLRAIRLDKKDRTQALRKLLLKDHPEWDRVLVFVATRYASEHVSRKLRRAGIPAMELHGKLDQDARIRRLSDFAKQREQPNGQPKIRVLLTTDIASRGLDIVGLPVVINYDLPRSTADFVHRVGRTGRAGKKGTAITFVTADNEGHMEMIEKRHFVEPIPREVLVGLEPNEEKWAIEAQGSKMSVPGAVHSDKGLVHDRMFGGIKGRRKSKKDRLREAAAAAAAKGAAANP